MTYRSHIEDDPEDSEHHCQLLSKRAVTGLLTRCSDPWTSRVGKKP